MNNQINTIKMIKSHEGYRDIAYQCSEGVWTIGFGHTKNVLPFDTCDLEIADAWFFDDLVQAIHDANLFFPHFMRLSHNRQAVLIDMSFNLGLTRLSEFKNLKKALTTGLYTVAAKEMKNSEWAKQVGKRADVLSHLMGVG